MEGEKDEEKEKAKDKDEKVAKRERTSHDDAVKIEKMNSSETKKVDVKDVEYSFCLDYNFRTSNRYRYLYLSSTLEEDALLEIARDRVFGSWDLAICIKQPVDFRKVGILFSFFFFFFFFVFFFCFFFFFKFVLVASFAFVFFSDFGDQLFGEDTIHAQRPMSGVWSMGPCLPFRCSY